MNEIRDILRIALPDTRPPSLITSQTALAAGRRLRRRHRMVSATVATGLAVFLTVGGMAWLRSPGSLSTPVRVGEATGTAPPSTSPSPPVTTPPASPSPSAGGVSPSGSQSPGLTVGIAPSVTQALLAATSQAAPNVTVAGGAQMFGGIDLGPYETVRSQGGIKAWALLSDPQGPGTLFINLNPGGIVGQSASCTSLPPDINCSTSVGPSGEPISIEEGPLSATARYLVVSVVKPNGTQVVARLVNYSEADQPPTRGGEPYGQRTTQILSKDQLIAIVVAPGVTIPPGLNL